MPIVPRKMIATKNHRKDFKTDGDLSRAPRHLPDSLRHLDNWRNPTGSLTLFFARVQRRERNCGENPAIEHRDYCDCLGQPLAFPPKLNRAGLARAWLC